MMICALHQPVNAVLKQEVVNKKCYGTNQCEEHGAKVARIDL